MARIYSNRGLAVRMNISSVVVAGSFLLGAFELWRLAQAGPEGAGNGYLFAALFLGGGVYAARQVIFGNIDAVVALDVEGGEAAIAVWRPFTSKQIVGPLEKLSDWRPYGKQVRRNVRTPMLLVDHPDYPRPLEFEIGPGIELSDEFKALAGEASAAFETPGAAAKR